MFGRTPAGSAAVRCHGCGAGSVLDRGFVKERRSFRIRSRMYCPPCAERRSRRSSILSTLFNLATIVALPVLLGAPWLGPNLALLTLFSILIAVPHELGHALVGRAVGLHVFGIVLGVGRKLWNGTILGIPSELRLLPFGGVTMLFPRTRERIRSRIFFATLAGPAVNLVLLAATLYLFGWPPRGEEFAEELAPLTAFILANGLAALVTLVPFRMQTVVGRTWSDGGLLLTAPFWRGQKLDEALAGYFGAQAMRCREQNDIDGAERWTQEGFSRYAQNDLLMTVRGMILLDRERYGEALELYRTMLAHADAKPELRAVVLNNLAYTEFLIGRRDLLEEADRFSAEALSQMHWQPAFLGTRGSVLVALGRAEEGLPLLQRAFDAPADDRSKALTACAIATGLMQRGDREGAAAMAATAERLDPKCVLLDRALLAT